MEPFDIVHNPLEEGPCLIEAGAGTGKTYALTSIFLRLLIEKHIPPDRILIVTFTTAATAELRDRLRRQLTAVRRFIDGQGPLDDTLRELVERAGPAAHSRALTIAALREFDRIAIFTIHGFCQRILTESAFETGSPFALELQADPSVWIQSAADDYWREIFHDAAPELTAYALDQLRGPETLARLYQRFRTPDLRIIPAFSQQPRIDFAPYRQGCAGLRHQWPAKRDEIAACLESPALKGNIYGSLKPLSGASPDMTKRKQKVAAWCRSLDFFLRGETAAYPPSPALIYFSSAKIAAATRKGQLSPVHPFFDDCQALSETSGQLQASLEEWATALRYGFFAYADRKLEGLKQDRQTIFYDDLLTRTAKALAGDRGRRLAAAVRLRYRAALVDEFQDTDSTQYQIFKILFGRTDHVLVMIGDPKQAIYGFRGADIFSYLEASRQSHHRFTLFHNWRSRPKLIQAVNALFENHPRPFLIPEIDYHQAVAAHSPVNAGRCSPDQAPLTFWLMTNDGDNANGNRGRLTKAQATAKILAAITAEVGRLLQSPSEDAQVNPGWTARDIAILVRTNRQARQVKACMTAAGIPAVIHNAGNVFGTPEADELAYVLRAVAQPNDAPRLKTALATRFLGWTGEELALGEPPPRWEAILERFVRYHAIWQEVGFFPFFRRMLTENRIAERLLRLTDGERRLTNLLHLGELLNQTVTQQRTGMRGTLKWMDEQRSALSGSLEEQQLRMESDAQALTILTIHKSKGLEFPVVFCPFSWESDPGKRDWPLFHDPEADMRRTLDIGASAAGDHQQRAQSERLAESLRLLYVAVTRAKERCFLVWGALPSAEASALTYLLDPGVRNGRAVGSESDSPWLAKLDQSYTDDDAAAALNRLVMAAGDSIAVEPLPEEASVPGRFETSDQGLSAERAMRRRFDPHWAITSFSALAHPTDTNDPDIGDRDRNPVMPPPAIIGSDDQDAAILAHNMHLFPGGAQAGNFFHRLFEIMDFRRIDPQRLNNGITAELDRFGFERHWAAPVTRLIENVMNTPLSSEGTPFCLNRLGPQDCVKELPFCFPLKRLNAAALRQVFLRQGLPFAVADVDNQLKRLNFVYSGGYLRGFIDLVFRVQGRYFLLDWKSNLLGRVYADYRPDRIKTIMTEAYYFLQYHLYALALVQFLRLRLPDYAYETHFGGIYYLFIRGMRPGHDADQGVFFDRPAVDLLQDLEQLLVNTAPLNGESSGGESRRLEEGINP